MKLRESITIVPELGENLLSEALRVSNSDIARVIQLSDRDILLGCEYEFHLNEDRGNFRSDGNIVLAQQMAEDHLDDRMRTDLVPLTRITTLVMDVFVDGSDFIGALEGDEPSPGDPSNEERLQTFAKIINASGLSFRTMLEGNAMFERGMPPALVNSMKNVYYDNVNPDDPESLERYFRRNIDDIETMIDEIEDLVGGFADKNRAMNAMINHLTRGNEWYDDELDAESNNALSVIDDGDDGGSDTNVDFVKSQLPDSIMRFVDKVELDSSVSGGVEVVTDPLRPSQALSVMAEMFSFIKEHGSTSNSTGLHVNISHRSFSSGMAPDPLKIMALMDVDAFQDATNVKRHIKYPERNHMVEQLTSDLASPSVLESIARGYLESGLSGMEDMVKHVLVRKVKYKSINWSHFLKEYDPGARRIEMRFFGGESYENRFKEISDDIKFIIYVINAVTNSSYKPETYYRGLYRILDRAAKRSGESSFNDILQQQRKLS